MEKTAYLITGASQGLGAALAHEAHRSGSPILGIARSAPAKGDHLAADFRKVPALHEDLSVWIRSACDRYAIDRWVLINNAGVLGPVGMNYAAQDAADHIAVNLTAAVAMTRQFLAAFDGVDGERLIVNISSGAATTAYPGWSLYCATKAGLEHFGRVVAEEQKLQAHPADVLSIAPGSLATPMQDSIRDYDASEFPPVEMFRERHRQGKIPSAELVAQRILRGLARRFAPGGEPFAGRTLDLDALDPEFSADESRH